MCLLQLFVLAIHTLKTTHRSQIPDNGRLHRDRAFAVRNLVRCEAVDAIQLQGFAHTARSSLRSDCHTLFAWQASVVVELVRLGHLHGSVSEYLIRISHNLTNLHNGCQKSEAELGT